MKSALQLLIALMLLVTGTVQAQTAEEVFNKGVAALGDRYVLNAIVCAEKATGATRLVYSNDFRESDLAYVFSADGVFEVPRTALDLQLNDGEVATEGLYYVFGVNLNGERLSCVESSMVLE